jgi:serine/threonine protein kinase
VVTGDGIIKGIDFGTSYKVPQTTTPKMKITYCGTPMYMAPEIIALEDIEEGDMVDPWKADIYSLGITLLAMMYPEIETRNCLLGMLV